MIRRAAMIGVMTVLAISSSVLGQDELWKKRFSEFARACGIDPSSKPRFFHASGPDWPEVCDPDNVEHEGVWDDAEVWSANGRAKLVQVVRDSQSGDWSLANYYCFRPNGFLSQVASVYATFNAETPFDYVRHLEFDDAGHVIRNTAHFYRMGTSENLAHPELHSIRDFAKSVPVYRNISELPMAEALKKRSSCGAK